ncbi:protein of unknown function [Taphrina deformans PYCC 5710]|uniref:mRNA-capping enzyme subunit alpha n=1 Tax=Taphrina deformans (strain PYCC 5710 / ATCC 11124 / CBS 356.35 / IMI 108563 / JCM 9778 / NBRC 8474) TaxID=1097556 RepID=R4XNN4_TAPDE|nr:protein of unknown function [Taphrina deformans PYCC 5710]|eukprot:CCG84856.1 protein of unknown function [Taphrina deformans PYCC 5710]
MAGDPPPIPGTLLLGPEAERRRQDVARLLRCGNHFPGAQPVSFTSKHLRTLVEEDYYVCEKSDGTRLLMYCTETDDDREVVFLVDRKNSYYAIPRLHFPLPNDKTCKTFHKDTILDGELVLDIVDGQKRLVYLTFDLLMYQGKDMRSRDLAGRLGKLKDLFLQPLNKFLKANPEQRKRFPFQVEFKYMQLSYGIEMMYREIIPKLNHGNDGLVFTSQKAPYTSGTDESLLKWKPAEENSVDFMLRMKFRERPDGSENFEAVPDLGLFAYYGEDRRTRSEDYRFYEQMFVDEHDWARLKEEGIRRNGLEGLIVECNKDKEGRWRFMRVRDDKQHANHISIVAKVLDSIRDGVTMEQLLAQSYGMRKAYKERHAPKAEKLIDQ